MPTPNPSGAPIDKPYWLTLVSSTLGNAIDSAETTGSTNVYNEMDTIDLQASPGDNFISSLPNLTDTTINLQASPGNNFVLPLPNLTDTTMDQLISWYTIRSATHLEELHVASGPPGSYTGNNDVKMAVVTPESITDTTQYQLQLMTEAAFNYASQYWQIQDEDSTMNWDSLLATLSLNISNNSTNTDAAETVTCTALPLTDDTFSFLD
ncbi:hypothetical protein GYMLUDRAFT_251561 [Collybiopsis luxurians FD-317 M1]|uniref:Unplaced genomic scaffold GYMLUscaffold_102, whole genome shotgun sequence n=1 Tax=Collybiopsis luxurians FD-317 M1 TaxID=944289 RepID=A0A0D0CAW1_9AGAR|nr:hypothetical protein GYMLUDRAFT_251561 [Collybiopsis luxurians FD-317 M1]